MTKGRTDPCVDPCECQGSMTCNNGYCGAKTTQAMSGSEAATVKNNFCAGAVGHPELQEFALRMGCPP